jgi:hypothetical protein
MSTADRPDHVRRAALGAGLALLAGCAAPAPGSQRTDAAPPPRVRTGDRWRYQRINVYNGSSVGDVVARVEATEPQIVVALSHPDGTALGTEVYAGAWNVVEEPIYTVPQTFLTPVQLVPPGATPGQRVRNVVRYRIREWPENSFYWGEWLQVVGWETVEVPAGRFDALRIDRRIAFESNLSWQRLREARHDVIWYAPAVNRWVRRVWDGTWRIPGFTAPEMREDWVDWRLLEYAPAA